MKLLGKQILYNFKKQHMDAESQLESWEAEVEIAQWSTPHALKNRYPRASIIGDQLVVFNICGNKYRLLTMVNYKNGIILIKKIGTHKEYDNWNLK